MKSRVNSVVVRNFENALRNEILGGSDGFIINTPKINGEESSIVDFKTKVLLLSPHSVRFTTDGIKQEAEVRTGTVVKYLSDKNKCVGVIKTKNYEEDLESTENTWFKNRIEKIIKLQDIKLILSFHQIDKIDEMNKHLITIETNKGRNIKSRVIFNKVVDRYRDVDEMTGIDTTEYLNDKSKLLTYLSDQYNITTVRVGLSKFITYNNELFEKLLWHTEEIINEVNRIPLKEFEIFKNEDNKLVIGDM